MASHRPMKAKVVVEHKSQVRGSLVERGWSRATWRKQTHAIQERDGERGCLSSQRWGLMGTGTGKPFASGIRHTGVWSMRENAVVTQQATVVKIMNADMRLPGFGSYLCHLILCTFG